MAHRQILTWEPDSFAEFMHIVTHPAFRIGFLDAQAGRSFQYDGVAAWCWRETPMSASQRWMLTTDMLDSNHEILAQRRYEEGRLLVTEYGLRCRSWNHPDYPPRAVIAYIADRLAAKSRENAEA